MRTRKNLESVQEKIKEVLEAHGRDTTNIRKSAGELLKVLKKSKEPEQMDQYKQLRGLLSDFTRIFEWYDGILINAMKTGGLLLIDEISLANDSVLERLNSVFEHGRTLTLSEKDGSSLIAAPGFNVVATMNPSGDFGKKELSPALRNRMTEIWVESYFTGLETRNLVGSDLHVVAKELVR